MLTYRATLKPKSATRSPWQADTLFGHLCWLIRYEAGESVLGEFLDLYRQEHPPLLFSNGFPEDWLPRPLLPAPQVVPGASKEQQVAAMQAAKTMQGIRWVSVDNFNALRRGEQVALTEKPEWVTSRTVLKNLINRLTFGTTPVDEAAGGGNLYNADELMFVDVSGLNPAGMSISIYVKAEEATWRDKTWAEWAEHWLKLLAQSGYGARKSAGYGQFEVEHWGRFTAFDQAPPEANGFISLSNWTPTANDPTNGYYARLVKYGKLGEEGFFTQNPFKFPLLMLTAGSSFYIDDYPDNPVRDWYGRLVQGIAPIDPQVVQYGYAFAIPARLEAER